VLLCSLVFFLFLSCTKASQPKATQYFSLIFLLILTQEKPRTRQLCFKLLDSKPSYDASLAGGKPQSALRPLTCESVVCYVYPSGTHTVLFVSYSWGIKLLVTEARKPSQRFRAFQLAMIEQLMGMKDLRTSSSQTTHHQMEGAFSKRGPYFKLATSQCQNNNS